MAVTVNLKLNVYILQLTTTGSMVNIHIRCKYVYNIVL